jgi:pilus assembly protein CpaF
MDSDRRAGHLEVLARELRARLLEGAGRAPDADSRERIRALVDTTAGMLDEATRGELVEQLIEESFGLGPLEPLISDPEVDEIMVSGLSPVWVERAGRLESTPVRFDSEEALRHAIERILAPAGRRVDESQPLADARLADGSRVNVVIPPLALDGPSLTIRRFRRRGHSPEELVAAGTLDADLLELLADAVRARLNILVCGGTGSGKTTTLNALSAYIGADERVVTIEDAAELRLRQPHVIRLEARPANLEGRGEVSIRALVRNALRMRPDRIVVGEVRGAEALDMLAALSTGHDGSMSTIHAGSPAEALRRLETLALMAGVGLPHAAVREQVADALHLVVCQERCPDGRRRVTSVAEVVRVAGGAGVRELYALRDGGKQRLPAMTPGRDGIRA